MGSIYYLTLSLAYFTFSKCLLNSPPGPLALGWRYSFSQHVAAVHLAMRGPLLRV